jgi:EF-P beta-lysylation protein EpmB
MEKNNPFCPIFLQFVPLVKEQENHERFLDEPVKDPLFRLAPKYLQKYEGRSLLLATKACAMHCRYCFRQNFSYETETEGFFQELELIRNNQELHEVILSGGDPLSLKNSSLIPLLSELNKIPHLKYIRFHTRTLIADPTRIDETLLKALSELKKRVVFVVHVNHPKELGEDLKACFDHLQKIGIQLLSQSVLLKGINDDLLTLQKLFFGLFDHGVLPYYLHQLDRVQGSFHFEVNPEKGLELIEKLRERMPGYLVPKYVQEIPQKRSKTPVERSLSP